MDNDQLSNIEKRINDIKARTPDHIRNQWKFEPYYDESKDVIIYQSPMLKKDGTIQGGRLQSIVGEKAGREVRGYRKAAEAGMLRGAKVESKRKAYSMIVEKQTERALSDDGNVQAAVFVAKAIGAFQRVEEKEVSRNGIQINISPEVAREILDRLGRGRGEVIDAQ